MNGNETAMLPLFTGEENSNPTLLCAIKEHLKSLLAVVAHYFPKLQVQNYDWVYSPFSAVAKVNEVHLQEEFIDLKNDRTLRLTFHDTSLNSFWIGIQEEYPRLSGAALRILLQFSTSWCCEHGFSVFTNVKNEKRGSISESMLEGDMTVALSNIRPDIAELCKKHQGQISH